MSAVQHGPLLEDAKDQLDRQVEAWSAQLLGMLRDARGTVPYNIADQRIWPIVGLLTLIEGAPVLQAALDQLGEEGILDKTTREEIAAEAEARAAKIAQARLAAEEEDVREAEAQAKRRRDALDRKLAAVIDS